MKIIKSQKYSGPFDGKYLELNDCSEFCIYLHKTNIVCNEIKKLIFQLSDLQIEYNEYKEVCKKETFNVHFINLSEQIKEKLIYIINELKKFNQQVTYNAIIKEKNKIITVEDKMNYFTETFDDYIEKELPELLKYDNNSDFFFKEDINPSNSHKFIESVMQIITKINLLETTFFKNCKEKDFNKCVNFINSFKKEEMGEITKYFSSSI